MKHPGPGIAVSNQSLLLLEVAEGIAGSRAHDAVQLAHIEALAFQLLLQGYPQWPGSAAVHRGRRLLEWRGTRDAISQVTDGNGIGFRAVPFHDHMEIMVDQKGGAPVPAGMIRAAGTSARVGVAKSVVDTQLRHRQRPRLDPGPPL